VKTRARHRYPIHPAVVWISLLVIGITLSGSLSGCGFHLRGADTDRLGKQLPAVYLSGVDETVGFGRELARVLRANGVKLAARKNPSVPVLSVEPIQQSRQVLSVDRNIRAREYVLISSVAYALSQPADTGKPAKRKVTVRRELVVDPKRILGSDQEERRLRREMAHELAQLLVLRLHY